MKNKIYAYNISWQHKKYYGKWGKRGKGEKKSNILGQGRESQQGSKI